MEYIINEKNGTLPINDWLLVIAREHGKTKYGMILDVYIKTQEEMEQEAIA